MPEAGRDAARGADLRLPLGSRLVYAFQQRFARTADLVIVPDAERGDLMVQALQLPQAPLIVANAPLTREPAPGEALRRELGRRGYGFERIV